MRYELHVDDVLENCEHEQIDCQMKKVVRSILTNDTTVHHANIVRLLYNLFLNQDNIK